MDILDEVIARTNIVIVSDQIADSIAEIEKKQPSRTDLTESMSKSRGKLIQSLVIFDEMRNELRFYKSHTSNLMLNIQMRDKKIEELELKIKEIMELL